MKFCKLRRDLHDTGSHFGPVGEFARLVVDLSGQFASGSQDESERKLFATSVRTLTIGFGAHDWSSFENLVQNGNQKSGRLAGTRLGAGHHVTSRQNDGNSVLLHRCRCRVACQRYVGADDFRQLDFLKLFNKLF